MHVSPPLCLAMISQQHRKVASSNRPFLKEYSRLFEKQDSVFLMVLPDSQKSPSAYSQRKPPQVLAEDMILLRSEGIKFRKFSSKNACILFFVVVLCL